MKIPEAFKENAFRSSKEYSINGTTYRSSLTCLEKAYQTGASYGYEQGVRDVVKALNEIAECPFHANWISEHFGLSEEGGKE